MCARLLYKFTPAVWVALRRELGACTRSNVFKVPCQLSQAAWLYWRGTGSPGANGRNHGYGGCNSRSCSSVVVVRLSFLNHAARSFAVLRPALGGVSRVQLEGVAEPIQKFREE